MVKIRISEDVHDETRSEYHRRVQDRMDQDSWVGKDDVGCHFPEPAIVHRITPPDEQEPPHVYDYGKRRY